MDSVCSPAVTKKPRKSLSKKSKSRKSSNKCSNVANGHIASSTKDEIDALNEQLSTSTLKEKRKDNGRLDENSSCQDSEESEQTDNSSQNETLEEAEMMEAVPSSSDTPSLNHELGLPPSLPQTAEFHDENTANVGKSDTSSQWGKSLDIGLVKNKMLKEEFEEQDPTMADLKPLKCSICRQPINEDLCLYGGHPQDAVDEFVALVDPRLSLFTGDENDVNEADQRPQNKLTCFSVYDKEGHLCPIDADLIERNVLLYISGYMKAIYEENADYDGGIPVKDVGPINEWFVSGFDGGQMALIGISTAYGEYFLMEPSEAYASLMKSMYEKIYLSKVVIEFLVDEPEATYEDLLNKLETCVPPVNIELTEDSLLRHAQFICDQVHSFDSAGDDGDLLIILPCMRTLIGLAGVTLGKRRAMRKAEKKGLGDKKKSWTKATTTDLVRNLFDNFFTEQLDGSDGKDQQAPRRQRCGMCETCQMPDCGNCTSCKDMTKFGGSGRSKQACLGRRCPNLAVQEAEDSEPEEDEPESELEDVEKPGERRTGLINRAREVVGVRMDSSGVVHWLGKTVATDDTGTYYRRVKVSDLELSIGDFVTVETTSVRKGQLIGKIVYFVDDAISGPIFHAHWFIRGNNTILGETADSRELFMHTCGFAYLTGVRSVVKVICKKPPPDWHMRGGVMESAVLRNDGKTFYYQKFYDEKTGRIEDLPADIPCPATAIQHRYCCLCERDFLGLIENRPHLVPLEGASDPYVKSFSLVRWRGEEYRIGQGVYLDPKAFKLRNLCADSKKDRRSKAQDTNDDHLRTELYRKSSNRVKGSNEGTSAPYCIGMVKSIFSTTSISNPLLLQTQDITVCVAKMYRPENTHRGAEAVHQLDLNQLYWSYDELEISLWDIRGKCYIMFSENLNMPESEWSAGGSDRFYFRQSYDPKLRTFDDPPSMATNIGSKGKGKGKGKSKGKGSSAVSSTSSAEETAHLLGPEWPPVHHKLKSLDLFCGCGGLSEGLHQAGISQVNWAIEKEEAPARAFRLNNPTATLFTEDCNVLLKQIIEGKKKWKGQSLPKKGEVELLCGGPPCQGFSGMNRFNFRQYSIFKNSLIVSLLSYCDYYRPRFFILENVRNFVAYKRNIVLKLTLRCLVQMGYQCTFGVLQAGNYGVPQTRRRAFILAAAPGEKLPNFPAPLHVFSPRAGELSIQVGGRKYKPMGKYTSAPYRTITVRDAMSDLPEIINGHSKEEMPYGAEPLSHFQRMIRGNQYQPILRDHICKLMNPLVEARIANIPVAAGADWRDLPNIEVKLSNGEIARKLVYSHHDRKQGKSPNGALRGVCSCAEGKPCDPMDHQKNTLIPWCLPHTANRHNHWAGLYGRLEWDGFFSTTVTNPEPMGKQGRVLHPQQTRVVSVRECARSQGFPDSFRFYGKVIDKHRQIGNAVPPPLGRAIGLEIRKCCSLKDVASASGSPVKATTKVLDAPISGGADSADFVMNGAEATVEGVSTTAGASGNGVDTTEALGSDVHTTTCEEDATMESDEAAPNGEASHLSSGDISMNEEDASMAEDEGSPLDVVNTTMQRPDSPVDVVNFTVQREESPVDVNTSVQGEDSPVDVVNTTVRRDDSPVDVINPVPRGESPVDVNSTEQKEDSLVDVNTTVQREDSSVDVMNTTVPRADSPIDVVNTTVPGDDSPVDENASIDGASPSDDTSSEADGVHNKKNYTHGENNKEDEVTTETIDPATDETESKPSLRTRAGIGSKSSIRTYLPATAGRRSTRSSAAPVATTPVVTPRAPARRARSLSNGMKPVPSEEADVKAAPAASEKTMPNEQNDLVNRVKTTPISAGKKPVSAMSAVSNGVKTLSTRLRARLSGGRANSE